MTKFSEVLKSVLKREWWIAKKISKDFLADVAVYIVMGLFAWGLVEMVLSTINVFKA